jgi:simple sugar transport system permease protein
VATDTAGNESKPFLRAFEVNDCGFLPPVIDGITVALLGKTDPFGVIPAALLLGAMRAGSNQMQFKAHVAQEITDVVQALMLFFVAADMIVRWLLRMRAAEEGEKITLSTGWGSH